ncbi:hypothetical protein MLD38_000060 [Melastoma candidum]|uniref:Uncharacterized protein n=1 Tax=Melastoma candidum TaxID=119954 RepID=A0ACB9S8U0_9MYRT|nr:hypothetical protein MLD38_000060 [Melastoma candidum]
MRNAEKELLKEGEAADEEQKKLKKELKKKGASSKDANGCSGSSKRKGSGSDEDHIDTSLEAAGQRIRRN